MLYVHSTHLHYRRCDWQERDETGPDALPKIHKYATTLYKIKTIIETYAVLNTYTHMYIKDLYMYIYI